jgi:NAD(P)-dependent dehydrogenase (short-subunit alcohol dehydrogenase family)
MKLESLADKRVLITASSKGLGKAIGKEFVKQGSDIVITSRSEERLREAKGEIVSEVADATDDDVQFKAFDLSDESEIRDSIPQAIETLGGLDILVNNHGGTARKNFDEMTVDNLDAAYKSVVRSTFLVTKLAIPALIERDGNILNIVSASAKEPPANHIPSNLFRLSLYGLSKSLANRFGRQGLRVNCISPRMVMTDRIEDIIRNDMDRHDITFDEAESRRVAELPMQRTGRPEEFARAAVFLASPAASYVTGTNLPVDGGWLDSMY